MTEEMFGLEESFAALNITPETSRSKAKRNKPDNYHQCIMCMFLFSTREEITEHLKTRHKANKNEVKRLQGG